MKFLFGWWHQNIGRHFNRYINCHVAGHDPAKIKAVTSEDGGFTLECLDCDRPVRLDQLAGVQLDKHDTQLIFHALDMYRMNCMALYADIEDNGLSDRVVTKNIAIIKAKLRG